MFAAAAAPAPGLPLIHDPLEKIRAGLRAFAEHLHDHFIPHARNDYRPHALSHRTLALLSALLVAAKIFAVGAITFGPLPAAYSSAVTPEKITELANGARAGGGLPALLYSGTLAAAAQAKAQDMFSKGYFAHESPDGKSPWDFVRESGYRYRSAGENLAVNFSEAEDIEDAWMNSPGHRANIMNGKFEEIGVGIASGEFEGRFTTFVVQMFGTPLVANVTAASVPTPVQTAEVPAPAEPAARAAPAAAPAAARGAAVKSGEAEPLLKTEFRTAAAAASPIAAEPVAVADAQTLLFGSDLAVTAKVTGPAVKVLATFGERVAWLSPKGDGRFEGTISLEQLPQWNVPVHVEAYGTNGAVALGEAGSVGRELPDAAPGAVKAAHIELFGKPFDVSNFEQNLYLGVVAAVVACLILAIGIRRHVQHVGMVANASFVAAMAMLLWTTA